MTAFSVSVLEGTNDDDVATYFCNEEPTLVSCPIQIDTLAPPVQGTPLANVRYETFVKFIPKNGHTHRRDRETLVPLARVVALTGNLKIGGVIEGKWPTPDDTFSKKA